MGEMVEFKSNGDTARGYLAVPSSGSGPGVIVVQEWWGLNPQIKGVADRLANEGFVALAPDLYRGELAEHDEMDKAGQLMSSMPMDRAARDMTGAVDFLSSNSAVAGDSIGAIGFCMGGGLVLVLATLRPDRMKAVVPFYGVVGFSDDSAPDWSKLEASVQGHYAENDDFFPVSKARDLEDGLRGLGKDATIHTYPAGHAFANETNALGTYDKKLSDQAYERTLGFLHEKLAADVVTRYLELGLRLGRLLDGLVDAYYGPEDLKRRVENEPSPDPARLVRDARALIASLDAGEDDLDAHRRRWIRGQVRGLLVTARRFAGDSIAFVDEVEECYGVRPTRVEEDDILAAHRRIDAVLPGTGPLGERLVAWREAQAVPVDVLPRAIESLADDFRERTDRQFGLPEGEHIDFDLVTNEPWSGFNYYLGGLRSRVVINTDLPVLSISLGHLVAHEAYPGHHTEHTRKEVGLVRRRGQLEETIFLVGTPQCLLAEGLADLGLEVIVPSDRHETVASHLRPLGIRYDAEIAAAVSDAGELLGNAVRGNVALMLHADRASEDDAVAYAERWGLMPHNRAQKVVEFQTDPTWRAYIFCYIDGLRLCRRYVDGDTSRFERLITDPVLPEDLAA